MGGDVESKLATRAVPKTETRRIGCKKRGSFSGPKIGAGGIGDPQNGPGK